MCGGGGGGGGASNGRAGLFSKGKRKRRRPAHKTSKPAGGRSILCQLYFAATPKNKTKQKRKQNALAHCQFHVAVVTVVAILAPALAVVVAVAAVVHVVVASRVRRAWYPAVFHQRGSLARHQAWNARIGRAGTARKARARLTQFCLGVSIKSMFYFMSVHIQVILDPHTHTQNLSSYLSVYIYILY